jgi:hypothetical protein
VSDTPEIAHKRAAYAAGIHPMVATDTAFYLGMTLAEIGEEWNVEPIAMLNVLAETYTKYGPDTAELQRKAGEPFSAYVSRLLPSESQ